MADVATIGHNNPPPDPIEIILAPLRPEFAEHGLDDIPVTVAEIVRSANAWANGVTEITSDEFGARCEDFLKQIREHVAEIDEKRKDMNRPHQNAIDANNAIFKPIGELYSTCVTVLKAIKAKCLQYDANKKAEATRLAKAEADRLKAIADAATKAAAEPGANPVENAVIAEQAQKAAAEAATNAQAAASAKPSVTGALTGRSSGYRTAWSAEITDWELAAKSYASYPKVQAAIQAEANADAKRLKAAMLIPGCKAVSEQKV